MKTLTALTCLFLGANIALGQQSASSDFRQSFFNFFSLNREPAAPRAPAAERTMAAPRASVADPTMVTTEPPLASQAPTLPDVAPSPTAPAPKEGLFNLFGLNSEAHASADGPGHHEPQVCGPPGRIWARADYLLWWTSGNRLPPLLTTSPTGTDLADAGVLGKPGTTVLFGDDTVNDGARSGARLTLGGWFNQSQTTGVEANFFWLQNATTRFNIDSDGAPILARPFFDILGGHNDSLKIAFPGFVRGSFQANVTNQFWGGEAYLLQNLCCHCCWRLDLLGGYRFLYLKDGVDISETEIGADPTSPLFGIPLVINEGFNTTNSFNGGEVGLRGEYRHGNCFVQMYGKIALGATSRTANINGTFQVNDFTPERGGFLALPTNIGNFHSTVFSAVPEVGVNVGYQLTPHLRVMGGYSFLWWTGVARAGDQIDTTVNISQPPLGDSLVGPRRPAFSFHSTDFWAQGLNLGVEFRF